MLEILEKALSVSKEINTCIAQNDWSSVEKLQLERDKILAKLPQTKLPTDKNDLAKVNQLVHKIKDMTQTQIDNSEERKETLLCEIKNNNKSKKMKTAYHSS